MKLPVVSLAYDGPDEMKATVENCLIEANVLPGVGDFLYVKVRKRSGLCYVRLMYKEFQWSNSDQLWKDEEFKVKLTDKLREIFSFVEPVRPSVGYRVLVADRIFIEKRENQLLPVIIELPERIVSITTSEGQKLVSEGFYNLFGKIVYVDQDVVLSNTAFFEGARMVYKTSNGYVVYRDNALIFPDGRKIVSPEPFDLTNDGRTIPWRVNVKSEGSNFSATVIGRFADTLVLSCGMIAPIDLSWSMRISGPIVEWSVYEQRLYVLDVAGYVRAIDLKNRRIVWEKFVPRAWGIAVHNGEIYIGSEERLLLFNDKGDLVEEKRCLDFGVSPRGIITLMETRGRFVRGQNMSVLLEPSKATVYTDQILEFEGVSNVRFFEWGIVLIGESGCWVVERR